jgi:hypothetical protein
VGQGNARLTSARIAGAYGRAGRPKRRVMRKYVALVMAVGALLAVAAVGIAGAAGGETPVTVKVGNLELTANGGFSPTTISKTKQTPIELKASGEVKEADGRNSRQGHPDLQIGRNPGDGYGNRSEELRISTDR